MSCPLRDTEKDLGTRLKGYEKEFETTIDPNKHIVCRIDGHKFSKYTKGFRKPYDDVLSKAMELTTVDLVEKFNAYTGYTQSDEITLIIPSLKDVTVDNRKDKKRHKIHKRIREDWEHSFGGRVQKTVSLISAYTTMRFNKHMGLLALKAWDYSDTEEWQKYCSVLDEKVGNAWFDCRIYGVEDEAEAFNSVMWRIRDAEKNSRSMFAQVYCSHRELQNLTGQEQVAYCLEKTGRDWEKVEDRYKYGILVKREQYEHVGYNPKSESTVKTIRSRPVTWSERMTAYSKEGVKSIMSQYR